MKTERNILIAFLLNLSFAIFECFGGIFTGSVAILSDAVHDLGDALSIGASFALERKSRRQPDETYTYGYARYSVLGSVITTMILLFGSAAVIYNAVHRLFSPTPIHYDGMILLAVVGVCVNACAAFFTRSGDSLNQKAVNLHMLEDVLGWIVVLAGAVIMRFTDLAVIDPLMSIGMSAFILIAALRNLKEALSLFLMQTPNGIRTEDVKALVSQIDGVLDVHHVHLWSMDGRHNYATMHLVTNADPHALKHRVRDALSAHGITHATLELEAEGEHCGQTHCHVDDAPVNSHHHHHHHH